MRYLVNIQANVLDQEALERQADTNPEVYDGSYASTLRLGANQERVVEADSPEAALMRAAEQLAIAAANRL